jgi:hypothetical protein
MSRTTLAWDNVLAWRMRRQFLDRPRSAGKTAGWIAPVLVWRGRVAGTWEAKDDTLQVVCFKESGKPPKKQIEAEAARFEAYTGKKLALRITEQ